MIPSLSFFFFNDTATTEIYTLSLHDALPISPIRVDGVLSKTQIHLDGKPGPSMCGLFNVRITIPANITHLSTPRFFHLRGVYIPREPVVKECRQRQDLLPTHRRVRLPLYP